MFNLPQLVLMPVINGAIAGPLEWPALGAVFAWLFVLLLLMASSALARGQRRTPSAPPEDRSRGRTEIRFRAHETRRKAA